jgi:flagellar hook assembly protein FlgD
MTLAFVLPEPGHAQLDLFDASGRRVRTLAGGEFTAGIHNASWDGAGADGAPEPAGIYFARLTTPHGATTRRLVRVR